MNRHERRKQDAVARKPYLHRFEPSAPGKQTIETDIYCECMCETGRAHRLDFNPDKGIAKCPGCGAEFKVMKGD